MIDQYGRVIDYMRVSVTDRCNLRCVYCMPEEGVCGVGHDNILRYEELLRVVHAGVSLGIDQIRITGGEPLVRKGIAAFVGMVRQTPGIKTVSMTTNGVLFTQFGQAMVDAGLDAVNFSLDCLNAHAFHRLTRVDAWDSVMAGISLAQKLGLKTKLNCVPMASYNSSDWVALAGMAKEKPLDVRFIEMMPIGLGKGFKTVNNDIVMQRLVEVYGEPSPSESRCGNGPAVYYAFPGFVGRVGFISAISHAFCDGCNRVRLTADGVLKPCLCDAHGVALKPLLRDGIADEALAQAMADAIRSKPKCHSFCTSETAEKRNMFQIGG